MTQKATATCRRDINQMGDMPADNPEDPFKFNIQGADGAWQCPCCGFPQDCGKPMYDEHGGDVDISICPACLRESTANHHGIGTGIPLGLGRCGLSMEGDDDTLASRMGTAHNTYRAVSARSATRKLRRAPRSLCPHF
jgi:hypothetical protein